MKSLGKDESDEPGAPSNMARTYLAEGESGWVEMIGPGYVRIANIPYDGRYNIDDLVKVDIAALAKDPYSVLKGKIERRVYPVRTILEYRTVEDFKKIGAMLKDMDGKMEGGIGPRGNYPGFLALAAKTQKDVLKIVRDLEIPQSHGWKPNTLK